MAKSYFQHVWNFSGATTLVYFAFLIYFRFCFELNVFVWLSSAEILRINLVQKRVHTDTGIHSQHMIWGLFFNKPSSPFPASKIRVSGECETKLYKGLTSGLASVSQTVKYPRGKVLKLALLHMALTVILCELWWHHGILWHHCSDSPLLLGIQYIVFVQTQESFVEKKG